MSYNSAIDEHRVRSRVLPLQQNFRTMKIQIHPHVGFLNTVFEILGVQSNSKVRLVHTADEYGNVDLNFNSATIEVHSSKFKLSKPGTYSVYLNGEKNDDIVVKNALRFGGSTFKNAYIFEGTPWCFIVMKDRTYFYNRDTKYSFSESVSPDSIKYVSRSMVLMSNDDKQDCTLFSLTYMKGLVNFSKEVYLSDSVLIFSNEANVLSLIKFADEIVNHKCLHYDDFVISKDKDLCIINSGVLERYSLDTFELLSSKDLKKSSEKFVCFFQGLFMLTVNEHDLSRLAVTKIQTGEVLKWLQLESFVSSVKGRIVNKVDFDLLSDELIEIQNKADCCASLYAKIIDIDDICVVDDAVYTVQDCSMIKLYRSTFDVPYKRKYSEVSLNLDCEIIAIENQKLRPKILTCKDGCLYVNYGSTTIVVKSGEIVYTTIDSMYIGKERNDIVFLDRKSLDKRVLYSLSKDSSERKILLSSHCINMDYFQRYGLVVDMENKKYYKYINGEIVFEDQYDGGWMEYKEECTVYCGASLVIFHNQYVAKKSFSDNLKCLSENGNYGISVRGSNVSLINYVARDSYRKENILEDSFDSTKYQNVILSDDGEMFISRTEDKCILVDVQSGEIEDFENGKYIAHVNGYRPTFVVDSYRKPRIIDPLTMNFVEDAQTSKFLFMSPNGEMYADSKLNDYVKVFNKMSEKYITNDELDSLKKKYDYYSDISDSKREEIRNNRREFIKVYPKMISVVDSFGQNMERFLLETDNFTSQFLEERGFAKIRRVSDDCIIADIELGPKLWFLNYVSFSCDNRYVAIAGRYPNGSSYGGLLLVYDLCQKRIIRKKTDGYAMWTVSFNINNDYAAYDSRPTTFFGNVEDVDLKEISGRNFLAFSPDGKYVALSSQGYIPYANNKLCWGHIQSTDVYIYMSGDFNEQVHPVIRDLSDSGIASAMNSGKTVSTVSFSRDNRKIMMAGSDGVVVIRNIEL